MTMHHTTRKSLIAEVVATLDEHLDGVTTEEEATSLIRAALRHHAALRSGTLVEHAQSRRSTTARQDKP